MTESVAIVLAAGKGTRMKSELPKVLHQVCGLSMVEHVFNAIRGAGVKKIVCIIGHKADLMRERLAHHSDVQFALQAEQKGTGHAVAMAEPLLRDHHGAALVLAGDTPLLKSSSLIGLLNELTENNAKAVVGTAITANNKGLGRVVRDRLGNFEKIVEEKDASPEQQLIQEINTGCYAFDCQSLWSAITEIRPNNSQGEYYLTDCPAILKARGHIVRAAAKLDIHEAMGVNTPEQLAEVENVLKSR